MNALPKGPSNDIAFPAAFRTISYWDAVIGSAFPVVHDESRNLRKAHWMLEAVVEAQPDERRDVAFDARLSYTLPFRATGLVFGRSQDHPQLQVCDLLAGAIAAVGRNAVDRTYRPEYAEALLAAGIDELGLGLIWPNTEDIKRHGRAPSGAGDPLFETSRLLVKATLQQH